MLAQALETLVLPATGVITWLDAASATELSRMRRIDSAPVLSLDPHPAGLRWQSRAGQTVFWWAAEGVVLDGRADEAELALPLHPPLPVSGVVTDPAGRFNPRRFSTVLEASSVSTIALYPSLPAIRPARRGALYGELRHSISGAPLPWAMLILSVTDALAQTSSISLQAGPQGDFVLPLPQLPAFFEQTEVPARLSVLADSSATPESMPDPDAFSQFAIASPELPGVFANSIDLTLQPGAFVPVRSSGHEHLAIQVV